MIKNFESVQIDLENGQILRKGVAIDCPRDIANAYEVLCTYEFLSDNYTNDKEELYKIAVETRDLMMFSDYPVMEYEAIEDACKNLDIELKEM